MGHDSPSRVELLQGKRDLLILRALLAALPGRSIKHIQLTTENFRAEAGSLYQAFHSLEAKGWIAPSRSKRGKRARHCRLMALRRSQVCSRALAFILNPVHQEER